MFSRWFSNNDSLVRVVRNSSGLFSAKGVGAVLSIFYLAILISIILFVLSRTVISKPRQPAPKSRKP